MVQSATWAALFALANSHPIATSPTPNAVSVWYHYTHGELLDGPGHGLDSFAADKRDAIKAFVESELLGVRGYPILEDAGAYATDFVRPGVRRVGHTIGGVRLALSFWRRRVREMGAALLGRSPAFTGAAASTPLLVLYGGQDTTITPDRAACVFERLASDGATDSVCFEPTADHGGIVRMRADYVNDWIANLTLGAALPGACTEDQSGLVDDAGAAVKCATPPPNN